MIKELALTSIILSLSGCASIQAHSQSKGQQSTLEQAAVEKVSAIVETSPLNERQLTEIQEAISQLSEYPSTKLRLGSHIFSEVPRLTIGPKGLPSGAKVSHLEEVFLLKTGGNTCYLVNEKSKNFRVLTTLKCRSYR